MRILLLSLIIFCISVSHAYTSGTFPLEGDSAVLIGLNGTHTIRNRETLIELARLYDVGYNEIADANSHIDPWVPENGTRILIPTSWMLPGILDNGIIINLAELRLYYFYSIGKIRYVTTYPLGIGIQGSSTPAGEFTVTGKIKDPVWHVPKSIREEDPELPEFVPPGPENPLGGYWLQLSVNGYGIHGTNRPYGIGRRVSHGCIRLYPEDIEVLSRRINPGTPVKILDIPVKAGKHKDKIYIEVHRSERDDSELYNLAVENLSRKRLLHDVDTSLMIQAIKSATGLPAVISR